MVLYRMIPGDPQARFYISKCTYCGRSYIKLQNRTCLCSDDCRIKSTQDSKAKYQRKRRRLIREGVLLTNESNYVGTGFLSKHANKNFKIEHSHVLKEIKRIGIK